MEIVTQIKELKRRIFGQPTVKIARLEIDGLTGGESEAARNTPVQIEIINSGNPDHKHRFIDLLWRTELGDEVTDFTDFTANFRSLVGCSGCDYEAIRSQKSMR